VRTSGPLGLDGGDGKVSGSSGGAGGSLVLDKELGHDLRSGNTLFMKPIQISGNISARGGACSGCTGGTGGGLSVYDGDNDGTGPYEPDGVGVEFLGYARAALNGGDALTTGGDVSVSNVAFTINTHGSALYDSSGGVVYDYWGNAIQAFPAGSIVNELDISARGGNAAGTDGTGGSGPDGISVYWQVAASPVVGTGGDITNSGAIDLSGGNSTGTHDGGESAGLEWYAPGTITNSGTILNRGGNAVSGTGGQGGFDQIWLVAQRDVVNSGTIDTTGGTGASGGDGSDGWSYRVGFYAAGQVRNSAPLWSPGGNATDAAAGTAGSGGLIELFSQSKPTANSATCNVAAGAGGNTKGSVGQIWIDSANVTPANGVL
jgi:hypothetical protein